MKKCLVFPAFTVLFILTAISANAQSNDKIKMSILGDSYSTFEAWVQPEWNYVWYRNQDSSNVSKRNDVYKVEQTWWHLVASEMGYAIEKNNAFSGSTICYNGYKGKDGEHRDYSDRSFIGRAGDLGHPDLILVCGGTNDSWAGDPVGEYKWKNWTNEDLHFFRPAMAKMCSELKELYPKARIVFILNSELRDDINESVHTVLRHYHLECIDLHEIEKQSGHPSIAGMRAIATQVEEALRKDKSYGHTGRTLMP